MLARDSPNDLSYRNTADTWLVSPSLPFPGLRGSGEPGTALFSGSQTFRPGAGRGGCRGGGEGRRGTESFEPIPSFSGWRSHPREKQGPAPRGRQSQGTAELCVPPPPQPYAPSPLSRLGRCKAACPLPPARCPLGTREVHLKECLGLGGGEQKASSHSDSPETKGFFVPLPHPARRERRD